jgi:hypothetical protein
MRIKKILKENEMDQAEIVLATKAVTDELQAMAEKLAKIEATSIMPLLDNIRLNFGPQYADQLSADATTSLQAVLDAVKNAKDQIGKNITNMQQIITGEGVGNDMASNVGVPDEAPAEPEAAEASDAAPARPAKPDTPDLPSDSDIDDAFADSPVGRDTKESAFTRATNMLRESADPDTLLLSETVRLSKKIGAKAAVMEVAKRFSVDAEDIVAIIRERQKK